MEAAFPPRPKGRGFHADNLMADDRVMIKCRYCGGWKMLLKYYASQGYTTWDNEILDWIDSHRFCFERKTGRATLCLEEVPFTLHLEDEIVVTALKIEDQNKRGDKQWN